MVLEDCSHCELYYVDPASTEQLCKLCDVVLEDSSEY